MDKFQAIEFNDGEILIYQDTPAHHNAHDLADFKADKTLSTVKRIFTLINDSEAQAEIDEYREMLNRIANTCEWWDVAEINNLIDKHRGK